MKEFGEDKFSTTWTWPIARWDKWRVLMVADLLTFLSIDISLRVGSCTNSSGIMTCTYLFLKQQTKYLLLLPIHFFTKPIMNCWSISRTFSMTMLSFNIKVLQYKNKINCLIVIASFIQNKLKKWQKWQKSSPFLLNSTVSSIVKQKLFKIN